MAALWNVSDAGPGVSAAVGVGGLTYWGIATFSPEYKKGSGKDGFDIMDL